MALVALAIMACVQKLAEPLAAFWSAPPHRKDSYNGYGYSGKPSTRYNIVPLETKKQKEAA